MMTYTIDFFFLLYLALTRCRDFDTKAERTNQHRAKKNDHLICCEQRIERKKKNRIRWISLFNVRHFWHCTNIHLNKSFFFLDFNRAGKQQYSN